MGLMVPWQLYILVPLIHPIIDIFQLGPKLHAHNTGIAVY